MLAVVPADQLLAAVRAWADQPWPLRARDVDALLAGLGWTRVEGSPREVRTDLAVDDPFCGIYVSGRFVDAVSFRVSDLVHPATAESTAALQAGFDAGTAALSGLYGPPTYRTERRRRYAAWPAPSHTLVQLVLSDRALNAHVVAPHLVADELAGA